MHNWGALIANAAGKSAPPAWSVTITAEKRPRAERNTDSISTWPKLSPACNKSRELATPAGTRCDARFYACNGGTLRSQEQHPHTLRDSSHTNSSSHGRAPGGHEAGARGGGHEAAPWSGWRTTRPLDHHTRRPPSTDPPLSCCEPPSAHPFPPEWRMRARRRSVSLHFVLISFRVPLGFPAGGGGGGGCWWELGGKRRAVLCAVPSGLSALPPPAAAAALPTPRWASGCLSAPFFPLFSPELGCSEIFRMCFSLVSWLGNLSCLGISPRVGLAVWGRLGGRGRAGWGEVRSVQPLVLRRVARGWGAALLCKFVTNLWRNDWNGGETGWPRSLVAFCREKMKYRARCSGASSRKGKKNCFKWPFWGWMWLL